MALLPPPELLKGIEEFNAGKFYLCHETLEELWLREPAGTRKLYQGILQVGVSFYHLLERKNFRGASSLLQKGIDNCLELPPGLYGIDISRFVKESQQAYQHLQVLGPERVSEFDLALVPKVYFDKNL